MSFPSSEKQALHLRPRSFESQRVWHIGESHNVANRTNGSDFWLAVCPNQQENFASLRTIINQLRPYARTRERSDLDRLEDYLREACPTPNASGDNTHGQLLTDSVTFAIMRRISRESVYTARVIDLGARTINTIISQIPNCTEVHVDYIDSLDRPTLKVLARAMLLLETSHGFSWIWHSVSDPTSTSDQETADIYVASRGQFLRQLIGILSPTLKPHSGVKALQRPNNQTLKVSPYDISAALVLQNYDACFLWCNSLLESNIDAEVVEGLRLMALAEVNVNRLKEALSALKIAEEMTTKSGKRAHLAYLQGLIEAKRQYDLFNSMERYVRGLTTIDDSNEKDEDLPLERGWLLNGIALNEAILWRRNPSAMNHNQRAFALEREAFDLVRDGTHPARIYLRFNLLANMAFLMEMQGNYDLAINIFDNTFAFQLDQSPTKQARWRSTIGYRLGLLHYRARRMTEAYQLIQESAEQDAITEIWATQERILRALGHIAIDRGAFAEAASAFAQGLEICRKARSAEGTREHARGLISTLLLEDKKQQAQEIYENLYEEEGLHLTRGSILDFSELKEELRPSPLSPKLPAYIPEIDLEGIPIIDLNRFLSKSLPQDSSRMALWRD